MTDPLLQDRKTYPDMTHWFNPALLGKLLLNVIVSQTFGQYADRRLMVAALDTVPPDELQRRAEKHTFAKDGEGAVWIDFVADLGDGFDATYAVASLLARENLDVDGVTLPRGQMLIMGGDEVYPAATAAAYKNQLRAPYAFALRDPDRGADDGIPVYAIPGNHDWYDGLVHFLAFFCRAKPWHLGGWRSQQRRSYFAVKVTDKWWVWCTDIQLADDMDQPQVDYFKAIAERMPKDTKIILCGAEPGWLYGHTNRRSLQIVSYAAEIAANANRGLTIPIILSGDTHHYSRYRSTDGKQFITSGGGGAFLHPTHQLKDKIEIRWMAERNKSLSLTTDPDTGAENGKPACYPTREKSRSLLWGDLAFPFTNWDFTILMGVLYWLFAVAISLRPYPDIYIITFAIFAVTLVGYTRYQEKSGAAAIYLTGIVHGLLHAVAAIAITTFFIWFNARYFPLAGHWFDVWLWLALLLVEAGVIGGLVGSFLFGLNLLVTCACFDLNCNDAFSAMRLDSHRHFLRIRIKDNEVTIYAVGLDKVPSRVQWQGNPKWAPDNPAEPAYLPAQPLSPHLIERPVVVHG
jgi:hypothetical protein